MKTVIRLVVADIRVNSQPHMRLSVLRLHEV